MPKYMVLFSFKGETLAQLMDNPSDRKAAADAIVSAAGGKLESYYLMFGEHDGLAIFDAPNSDAAAAVALRVSSSGAFSRVQTHELIEASHFTDLLGKAKGLAYKAPGT